MTPKEQWLTENLRPGELYAGLILNEGGRDYHLILLPDNAVNVTWGEAMKWAAEIGGALPTLREQSLLFANLKHEFKPNWYWSSEQHADFDVCAWNQDFYDGLQHSYYKSASLRARSIRRIYI